MNILDRHTSIYLQGLLAFRTAAAPSGESAKVAESDKDISMPRIQLEFPTSASYEYKDVTINTHAREHVWLGESFYMPNLHAPSLEVGQSTSPSNGGRARWS